MQENFKYDSNSMKYRLLILLKYFDAFCKKNKIIYSSYAGTMLGQIRESGFIPWDDDIDIVMTRLNFNKFLKVWNDNESYKLIKPTDFKDKYFDMVPRIIDNSYFYKTNPLFKEYSELQHPWIDIFILDKCPSLKISFFLLCKKQYILQGMLSSRRKYKLGKKHNLFTKIGILIFQKIGRLFDLEKMIFRFENREIQYNHSNSDYYYCSNDLDFLKIRYNKTHITNTVEKKFESLDLPSFKGYNYMLKAMYGNYMVPVHDKDKYIQHFS